MAEEYFRRSMKHIDLSSGAVDPDVYIGVRKDFFTPLMPIAHDESESARLAFSLNNGEIIPPSGRKKVQVSSISFRAVSSGGRKKKVDDYALMQKFHEGKSVREIMQELRCSESYVYQTIKRIKGISAMELRYQRWKMISDLYFAKPRKTVKEIESICQASRWQIYNAVKNMAEKEAIVLSEKRRDLRLSDEDIQSIRQSLDKGVTRKNICRAYNITPKTLVKYIGPDENYRLIPEENKEKVVRLRVQGKTLAETAEILGVNLHYVKRIWKEHRDSHDVIAKRVKYDNRNPLTKRDRDQAVNAVLIDGITRKKVCEQYGINALTLRRYIRAEKQRQLQEIRDKEEGASDSNKR
ncbi:helix-turn-helix domain-containing protein [Pantoea sp. BAV 3049]|uniref:helix-turn-helix domain-containing protein n=1 Tax=Pantoea sp. BAV 3049 TaxID=2654188 RepID=UPI00131B53B1|nr:helix-turn-helix domain-containing protein [Pantoea sp. BAV 3049]